MNLKSVFQKSFTYLSMGIGALLYLFFRNYRGDLIPYPVLWFSLGILLFWLPTIIAILRITFETSAPPQAAHPLKTNGYRVKIDLKECEVVSNRYYNEIPTVSGRAQTIDVLYGAEKLTEHVEVNVCVLTCKIEFRGKPMEIRSVEIRKDPVTLQFLLEKQKTTDIYIDKSNPEKYYFDIEFLNR